MSLLHTKFPEFSVTGYQNEVFKNFTDKMLDGKWNVLFFYPADFSFVCPTELEELQKKYPYFKKYNCGLFSVSSDSHFVHKAWHDNSERIKKIEYPMLSDPTHSLINSLGILNDEKGLSERATFILNPEKEIVSYEIIADNVGRNCDELLRRLVAHQFVYENGDQVCPAKWVPGAKTLAPTLDLVGKL